MTIAREWYLLRLERMNVYENHRMLCYRKTKTLYFKSGVEF